jgi:hypothetical protein
MSRGVRWGVAVGLSVAAFALGWWVCARPFHRDEGISLAVAGAALAIVLAVGGFWAALEPKGSQSGDGGSSGDGWTVTQDVKAGEDAYVAGRDLNLSGRDSGGGTAGPGRVKQKVRARKNANVAGRDLIGRVDRSKDT